MESSWPVRCLLVLTLLAVPACNDDEASPEATPSETPAASTSAPEPTETQTRGSASANVQQRVDDRILATRVRIALGDERALRAYDFDLEAQGGEVTLRGEVETASERDQAAAIARETDGVERVVNQITAPGVEADPDPIRAENPERVRPAPTEDAHKADESQQEDAVYYTVQSGDNLWLIAREHDLTVSRLRALNDLGSDNLKPGQRLRVK